MFALTENPFQLSQKIINFSAQFDEKIIQCTNNDDDFILPKYIQESASCRQAEFIASRRCARHALKKMRPEMAAFVIYNNQDRSPIWPLGLIGSLTHTKNFTSVVIANASDFKAIGIDTEWLLTESAAREIRNAVLSKNELNSFLADWDETILTTVAFSAKESIYKCLYPELKKFFDFLDVELLSIDLQRGQFHAAITKDLSKVYKQGYRLKGLLRLTPNYVHTATILEHSP